MWFAGAEADTMNSVQREFIRLAQIFKARLITELELKQRVIERTMIEDQRLRDLQEEEEAENSYRPKLLSAIRTQGDTRFAASVALAEAIATGEAAITDVNSIASAISERAERTRRLAGDAFQTVTSKEANRQQFRDAVKILSNGTAKTDEDAAAALRKLDEVTRELNQLVDIARKDVSQLSNLASNSLELRKLSNLVDDVANLNAPTDIRLSTYIMRATKLRQAFEKMSLVAYDLETQIESIAETFRALTRSLRIGNFDFAKAVSLNNELNTRCW